MSRSHPRDGIGVTLVVDAWASVSRPGRGLTRRWVSANPARGDLVGLPGAVVLRPRPPPSTPRSMPRLRRRPADTAVPQAAVRPPRRNVITWPDGYLVATSRAYDDGSRDPLERLLILVNASSACRSESGRVWR